MYMYNNYTYRIYTCMTLFMYMICSYYGLRMFLEDMIHILMCHYHCNLLEREMGRGREGERERENECKEWRDGG